VRAIDDKNPIVADLLWSMTDIVDRAWLGAPTA
jgi:hypothetical protein